MIDKRTLEDLLPSCPFCGRDAEVWNNTDDSDWINIQCSNHNRSPGHRCGVRPHVDDYYKRAIKCWAGRFVSSVELDHIISQAKIERG